jgi:hydroxyacylglutathione hydrolase
MEDLLRQVSEIDGKGFAMLQGIGRVPQVPEVDVLEAQRKIAAGNTTLLDVREIEEYEYARIQDAINIPLGEVLSRTGELPAEGEILVYCQTGIRSAFAVDMLGKAGVSNAINVAGGLVAWNEGGLPVVINQ